MPHDELPEDLTFDPQRMLEVLARREVAFVVVGGIAAVYHASPYATFDLDICPAEDDENLRRLAAALEEMDARMRGTLEPASPPVAFDPRILRATPRINLETTWGPLDIVHTPAASRGFEELSRSAISVELGGLKIAVASRADILRSKEAIYREKDLPTIRLFRELEERDQKGKPENES